MSTKANSPHLRSRPVLREVAERAGVSMMTVSRVLNGRPDVAPATRDAVLRHAMALGYTERGPALPSTERTGLIAVTVPFIRNDYFTEILAGAADALEPHESKLVVCPTRHEHDREAALLAPLLRREAAVLSPMLRGWTDGALLIAPSESPEELAALRAEGHALVIVDPHEPLGDGIPSIGAMNMAGARTATDYLISLGHRRIGVVTGPLRWMESADRLAGYRAAIVAAGLPFAAELVAESDYSVPGGEEGARRLLALSPRPTALFCCNDNMAAGALRAAAAAGIQVPLDLSIVGFDDVEAASLVTPALTTVRQPLQYMGRTAVSLLLRLLEGLPIETQRVEVPTRLIVRSSTCPLSTPRVVANR